MIERKIDNRGSKSIVSSNTFVKEQRADGSLQVKSNKALLSSRCLTCLRYALKGFERNLQIRIHSKQIVTHRVYTNKAVQQFVHSDSHNTFNKLHPAFISGITDGEGSFIININKNNNLKFGWNVQLEFKISLHCDDKILLERIQFFFGVGKIYKYKNILQFRVESIKELKVIVNHFDNYPLITNKRADYELFRKTYDIVISKEHLNENGLKKIVALKASLNKGLSDKLKIVFSDIVPVDRPLVQDQSISDPFWLAGFTTAEGCFFINLNKSSTTKTGFSVSLRFTITQHYRDEKLIKSLIKFFDCGNIYFHRKTVDYVVRDYSSIKNIINLFFVKYPIEGVKSQDFKDFCKVAEMMYNKEHLTFQGLNQIRIIKAGMNKKSTLLSN